MGPITLAELKDRAREAGVVGAGGAGFPAAVKLAQGADSYIINGAECEPLIFTDYHILRTHMEEVLYGARRVMDAAGIQKGYLAIKEHTARRFGFVQGQRLEYDIQVAVLPNVYPMGDEVILIYQVLGRIVQPGGLPLSVGVIVNNVETVLNLGRALDGFPVTEKWLTVAGAVPEPVTVKVKVGTRVQDLLAGLGYEVPEGHVVLDGGPAMGNIIRWQEAAVTKTTKGILILPEDIPAITAKLGDAKRQIDRASSVCCQCTLCTEMCPRALLGYGLAPHRTVRSVASTAQEHPEDFLSASVCCGCGVCDLVACCQGILPRKVMMQVRGDVAAKKMKYQQQGPVEPNPDRDFRLLPNKRFKAMSGVAPFDRMVAKLKDFSPAQEKLVLPLKQHVGAPAQCQVQVGDEVAAGAVLAEAAPGVSARIHAPAAGRVTRVTDRYIELALGQKVQ